jgi:hypothetical protein
MAFERGWSGILKTFGSVDVAPSIHYFNNIQFFNIVLN